MNIFIAFLIALVCVGYIRRNAFIGTNKPKFKSDIVLLIIITGFIMFCFRGC